MVDNYQLDVALNECERKITAAIEDLQSTVGAGFDIDVSTTFIDISVLEGGLQNWPRVRVTVSRSSS